MAQSGRQSVVLLVSVRGLPGRFLLVDLNINRRLQMWRYGISHGELVLMSTNDVGEYPTRFYVLLKAVSFVSLPTDFLCERITSTPLDNSIKFQFATNQGAHYVVADYLFHGEDSKPWHAPLPFGVGE